VDRRRYLPRRRSARVLSVAALSALGLCLSSQGGLVALAESAHKPPPPSPSPLPTAVPTATPKPTPTPTPEPTEKPAPAPTPEHHAVRTPAAAVPPAPAPTKPPAPPSAAPPTPAPTAAHTPHPAQLAQHTTSLPTTLASFAANPQGGLSPYVLGADLLAGLAVAGSVLLAELRRRRLV